MSTRLKKQTADKPEEDPLSRLVIRFMEGPTPPDRVAAEEKFWKSIITKMLATENVD